MSWIIAISIFILTCVSIADADTESDERPISMSDCVAAATHQSFGVQSQRLDFEIAQQNTIAKTAAFDPRFSQSLNRSKIIIPSFSSLDGTVIDEQEITSASSGISQKLYSGASVGLAFDAFENKTDYVTQIVNPYFRTDFNLTLDQPLLKGFGRKSAMIDVDLAQLNQAGVDHLMNKEMQRQIVETKKAYWKFVYAYQTWKSEKDSLARASRLMLGEQERFRLGEISRLEVLKAEKKVFERRDLAIEAEGELRSSEIDLKISIGLPVDSAEWSLRFHPTDGFEIVTSSFSADQIFVQALQNEPDYVKLQDEIKVLETKLWFTKDQMGAGLDFVAGAGLNGLSDTFGGAVSGLKSGNFYNWQTGIVLSIPLGNREAKSRVLQAQLELNKKILEKAFLKQSLYANIRKLIQSLDIHEQSMANASGLLKVAQQHYEDEAERQKLGDTDNYYLLELLDFLSTASGKFLKGGLERQLVINDIEAFNLKAEIQKYWSHYGKHQN